MLKKTSVVCNYSLFIVLAGLVNTAAAASPTFKVVEFISGQTKLNKGQQGTYVYQVTNNTSSSLTNIGLLHLPDGVSLVANAGYQYCTFPLTLSSQGNCLLKLNINGNVAQNAVKGGPKVCYSASNPIYCNLPVRSEQLATQMLSTPVSDSCSANVANFNYELSQTMDSTVIDKATIQSWGPARNHLFISKSEPNLLQCTTTDKNKTVAIAWMQNRVLAAYDYWVKQKLNYCHHHVTDFATPLVSNGTPRGSLASNAGGYCSNALDAMPGSKYYGKPVRWNYNGEGSETEENWINNNQMWHGVDCSDFTSFIYNYAFGMQFNSDTGFQAGQAEDGSQDKLTPNGQTASNRLKTFTNDSTRSPAGVLVCKDGKTEREVPECGGLDKNAYFSVFLDKSTKPKPENITPAMLNLLQPGDLLFLGFAGHDGNNPHSMVTHVITWTGKKVGYGTNDINPKQIAPEEICPDNWQPQIGDWVIVDSHYQGPDYRVFTPCFYQNNVWGVRRVIGYMESHARP